MNIISEKTGIWEKDSFSRNYLEDLVNFLNKNQYTVKDGIKEINEMNIFIESLSYLGDGNSSMDCVCIYHYFIDEKEGNSIRNLIDDVKSKLIENQLNDNILGIDTEDEKEILKNINMVIGAINNKSQKSTFHETEKGVVITFKFPIDIFTLFIDDLGSKFELKVLNNDNIFRTRDYDENN